MAGLVSISKGSRRHRMPVELQLLEGRRLLSVSPATLTTVANASEAGPTNGSFRVTRTDTTDTTAELTVTIDLTGTATYGADYTTSVAPIPPATNAIVVTIPIAATSTLVTIMPVDDSRVEGTETVIATVEQPMGTTYTPDPTATVNIVDNDRNGPPTVNPRGPYSVTEGQIITVRGTASAATNRTIAEYDWDFNYDGTTFHTEVTGATAQFSAAGIDGVRDGTPVTIGFRAIDSTGEASAVATTIVTVNNRPPTAKLKSVSVKLGQSATVSFSNILDIDQDEVAGFTYRYDFNNDAVTDLASHKGTAIVPASYLSSAGTHIIHANIRDKDGGNTSYPVKIIVTAAASSSRTGSGTGAVTGIYHPFGTVPIQPAGPLNLDDLILD